MKHPTRRRAIPLAIAPSLALALASGHVLAMNTTETNASGAVETMMGGASIANPLTSAIAGDNPAGMSFIGNRSDLGGQVLVGRAQSTFAYPGNEQSFDTTGPIPSGGVNVMLGERLSAGLSISSAGGGVSYPHAALQLPDAPPAKTKDIFVNLLPTLAYRITPDLAVGASAILGIQKFEAQGLVSPTPDGGVGVVPTHGMSTTFGYGGAFGVLWQPTPLVTLGASYSTKVHFGRASGYADDLFASAGGHLDEPARYGAGLALHLTPQVTLAADVVRILWSNVGVLGDPQTFGLHDQTVLRVGASWDVSSSFTLRVGGNHATNSVDSNHTAANYFAPMILTDSISAGVTWRPTKTLEMSAGYEYDIPRTIVGTGASTGTNIHARYSMILFNIGTRF